MHEIETDRVLLRPFTPADLDDLCAIRGDREVMYYMRDRQPMTRAQTEENLGRILAHYEEHDFGFWAAVDRRERQLMGYCGLQYFLDTTEVEIGYMLAKPYWGRGLATEMGRAALRYGFEGRQLDRVMAIAYPDNLGSRRVMEKLGMRYEGHFKFYDPQLVSREIEIVRYAIARDRFAISDATYILRSSGG